MVPSRGKQYLMQLPDIAIRGPSTNFEKDMGISS